MTIDGQVAVITGGAGGLGSAYVRLLTSRGARVVVNDLPPVDGAPSPAELVVAQVQADGGTAVADHCDITTPDGAEQLMDRAMSTYGRLDILVNNAGIVRPSPFDELSDERLNEVLEVNLSGTLFPTRVAYRLMKRAGYGRIVNTSSSAGVWGMNGMVNYGVTKAAVFGLTVNLALESAEFGVGVNAILPNAISTISVANPIVGNTVAERGPNFYKAKYRDRFVPDAVAPLVAFLASPECRLNGEAFSVIAGRIGRVFVGAARGWVTPSGAVTPEEIAEHLDQIRTLEPFDVPTSVQGEYELIESLLSVVH